MANAFETEEEMIERAKQASLTDGADPPTYVDDRGAPPGYVTVPSHDVDSDDEDDLYRGVSANTQDAIRLSLQGGLQAQTSGGSSTGAVADSDDSGDGDDQWRPPEPTVGAPSPAAQPPEEPPREPEPEPAASPHSPHVEPPYVAELVSGGSATHNQVKMETVLRAVENEGSSLSADNVRRTMDSMLSSGKLQPHEYGMHAGKCVARFYNLTPHTAVVETDGRRSLRVGPAGSVLRHPWKYRPNHMELEPGTQCFITVGDFEPCEYWSNDDPRQVIFLERLILPEEKAFEKNVLAAGLSAAREQFNTWKADGGKRKRRELLAAFEALEPAFNEQVAIIEAAIGKQRATITVDDMRDKVADAMEELRRAHDFTGLVNQSNTCYMNSLLQSLYMTPELRFALYQWQWREGGDSKEMSIPYQLQKLFANLQTADKRAVETTELTHSFGWTAADAFQQHDVNELFNILCDSLENNFRGTHRAGVIASLFQGKEKDYLRCLECGHENSREEVFNSVLVPVKNFGDPYPIRSVGEGLEKYYTAEKLCGDNQWECPRCKKRVDAMKGLGLTKVPYLLSLNLQRFVFDWEREQAVKLQDEITFPLELDAAQFLIEEQAAAAGGGGGAAGGAAGGGEPAHSDFGKDGTSVLMRGRSHPTIQVSGKLPYDLFAILVHSGVAGGGHYYAYIRDFAKDPNQWFEFNDARVTGPLTHDDLEKAFGGETWRNGYYSTEGTAYMLMYRRREPEVNIDAVPDEHIPESVHAAIAADEDAERVAAEAAEAKREREYNACPFAVCHTNQMKVVWVKNDKTWAAAMDQIREELGLENPVHNLRLNRLEPISEVNNLRQTSGSKPALLGCDSGTLVSEVPNLQGSICSVEVKADGVGWSAEAPPMAATGVAHIHFSDVDGSLDVKRHLALEQGVLLKDAMEQISQVLQVPENEALHLFNSHEERVSGLAMRCEVGAYLRMNEQWIREAALATVGDGGEQAFVGLLGELELDTYTSYNNDIWFVNFSALPIRVAVQKLEWSSTMYRNITVTRTLATLAAKASDAAPATFTARKATRGDTYELSCFSVGFHDQYHITEDAKHNIVIVTDKVPIVDARTLFQCKTGPKPKAQAPVSAAPLPGGKQRVPIYRFHGRSDDLSDLLFCLEVDPDTMEEMTVPELKTMITERMRAESIADAPADPQHLRLCELGHSVFCDEQTVHEAFGGVMNGAEKIGVSVRDSPEDKTGHGQRVVCAIRYRPSTYTLDEEHVEITLESSGYDVSARKMKEAIDAATEGALPAERISVACNGTAYGKMTGTAMDMAKMVWDYTLSLKVEDMCLFYYKDMDEPESQLSDDEKAQLCKRVALARRKKTKASDERADPSKKDLVHSPESGIHIRGTGPAAPTSPSSEQAPPPYEEPALDHTLSGEIYSSLLSNPRLSDEHRDQVAALQRERQGAAGGQDGDDLTQWLSRTESRKSLAKQRRELEILQALGPAPADPHQLVRTPSARARGNQTELARLEAGNTQEEIASVEAEIMRLKAELGLQDRV